MKAYIGLNPPGRHGQPSAQVRRLVSAARIGAMVQPGFGHGVVRRPLGIARDVLKLQKTFPHWAFDNGAFSEHLQGRAWPEPGDLLGSLHMHWVDTLEALAEIAADPSIVEMVRDEVGTTAPFAMPDFVVLPDLVGAGRRSLDLSLAWLEALPPRRYALVVQEGMVPADLPWHDARWSVVFVGGAELTWKDESARGWARAAREHGRRCHVGRVGGMQRVGVLRDAGADSIDSGGVAWSIPKLENWIEALDERTAQLKLEV